RQLGLLSAEPDPALDRLCRIAATVTGADIAMITFIAGERQFVRSRVGTDATVVPSSECLCRRALDGAGLVEIDDAVTDPRGDGVALGTVCVLHARARRLSDEQRATLVDLGGMVESLLRSRHEQRLLDEQR